MQTDAIKKKKRGNHASNLILRKKSSACIITIRRPRTLDTFRGHRVYESIQDRSRKIYVGRFSARERERKSPAKGGYFTFGVVVTVFGMVKAHQEPLHA